jgi:deoxyribose-phosphate aldolase
MMNEQQLARFFDATNLRLDATPDAIRQLCRDSIAVGAYSVMIYPTSIALAVSELKGTPVKIGTVAGFPSGRFSTAAKAAEIVEAARCGAHEVDVVALYPALIAGEPLMMEHELMALTKVAHDSGVLLKVIVETCFLPPSGVLDALRICESAGADFIKTSTGFGSAGAKVEHIALWKSKKQTDIQIKAAGGIRNLQDALSLIEAGADRLGLSAALAIMDELRTGHGSQNGSGY